MTVRRKASRSDDVEAVPPHPSRAPASNDHPERHATQRDKRAAWAPSEPA
jgi:hypothetical protein